MNENIIKQKVSLPEINLTNKFNVIITEEFNDKVKYICNCINTIEWSGILFYKYKEGDKLEDFEYTPIDIHLMDIGSGGYTSFDSDETLVDVLEDKEYLFTKDIRRGFIHSHNNMGTSFSGTDINELNSNSENYKIYLSLIVNNHGDYNAKIAIRGTRREEKGFLGKIYKSVFLQFSKI